MFSKNAATLPRESNLLLIAEISSNHNRDISRALELIRAAHRSGANAVKFQLFEVKNLFSPEVLESSPQHLERKAWELPRDFIPRLAEETRALGMLFGCTPFDLEAVKFLEPHVDFYKIASYELLWLDLISSAGRTGKPVILSTGMATESEVAAGVNALRRSGSGEIALLHCVSAYPAPIGETNLRAIETLRRVFGVQSGWSDHTHDPAVVLRAINRWDASIIELHFDIDGQGYESSGGHCWLPEELLNLTKSIGNGAILDGTGEKTPAPSELSDVNWRADPSDGLRPLRSFRPRLEK